MMNKKTINLIDTLFKLHCSSCDGENSGCTGCDIEKQIIKAVNAYNKKEVAA